MSGAKNCPETPRQKMIGMMYLVLTAMLALNVSADILRGFTMVNKSMMTTIETSQDRNKALYARMEYMYEQNKDKVGQWLEKAKVAQQKSDEMYNYLQTFKVEMIKIADGRNADPEGKEVIGKDNTEAASNYGITQKKGDQLKNQIDSYREFVEAQFGDDKEKNAIYNQIFSTESEVSADKSANVTWVNRNFESMPLSAAVTMLSKYQADVRSAETEMIQHFMSQTDAKDFRVNQIRAEVIPESKNVVQGGQYKARIILSASDTTARPEITVNGAVLPQEKKGEYIVTCNSIGEQRVKGVLMVRNPATNEMDPYEFDETFNVVAPSATIANMDMNVVYMGYANRISISVPGIPSEKITPTAPNATFERTGSGLYICRPKSYDDVIITVTASLEGGHNQAMGSSKFRVRTLPDPTAFLKFKDGSGNSILYNPNTSKTKLTRANLNDAVMVAEYADGLLQATFSVKSFTMYVSDGRGGMTPMMSEGSSFSGNQKSSMMKLKPGSLITFDKINITGAKTTTLSYPPISLP